MIASLRSLLLQSHRNGYKSKFSKTQMFRLLFCTVLTNDKHVERRYHYVGQGTSLNEHFLSGLELTINY